MKAKAEEHSFRTFEKKPLPHSNTLAAQPFPKPLSERLIREMSAVERKRHPGKSKAELREMVIDKYAPKWRRK